MKCQFCDNQATVHLTRIIEKKKREMHLCETCAREHDLVSDESPELNVPALLQFLMNQSKAERAQTDTTDVACPHCGMKYAQFRVQGRLGCPADYELFRVALLPLLERIHRHVRHVGKSPGRTRVALPDLAELRRLLGEAVREERYEEAAVLRDRLRSGESLQ